MTTTVTAKSRTLSNGTPNDAGPVESNFVELYNNDQTLATAIDQVVDGTTPFSGEIDFPDNIKSDVISESTAGVGVTIDSVLLKDGVIKVPGSAGYTPTANGDFGYDSTDHTYDIRVNGTNRAILHTGSGIDSLSDVTITGATSGQVIKHDGSGWVNGTGVATFVSTAQTITTSGTLTIAHGLSGIPEIAGIELVCTTGEHGYSIGDRIDYQNGGPISSSKGATIVKDATNVVIIFGNDTSLFAVNQKSSTHPTVNLTNASWSLYVRAVKF